MNKFYKSRRSNEEIIHVCKYRYCNLIGLLTFVKDQQCCVSTYMTVLLIQFYTIVPDVYCGRWFCLILCNS